MSLFRVFSKKKIRCRLCNQKFPESDQWKLHMETAEGRHIISVCPECAKVLDESKENVVKWLNT
jgi:NAD-dependent SIR2 family protein deacetylase